MSKTSPQPGDLAKDRITGFTGVVIARAQWRNNCDRLVLQPQGLKDGKRIDAASFDEPDLELVEHAAEPWVPIPPRAFGLGDEVRDTITGLEGVVIARTEWLARCDRYRVQPKGMHEGKPLPSEEIDGMSLVLVAAAEPPPAPVKTGGPRPESRR